MRKDKINDKNTCSEIKSEKAKEFFKYCVRRSYEKARSTL